ncbi:Do family serine endopeptidase [Ancylomarina euxinus]|uniref:Do family serine endopeptidase n=1 Tax=Ancylomarina euxinus TaxID=2283627 RepID=A0A425XX59_9BACT|nr:Do family serine endopeptidase [Ancylomarina euxinus]MCZ4696189.1 Do family serine endopeptidase [Ancylomarina euxinus]MUP16447.1 Do family serine endopeptidase [Ancylomarina euxinus]RRG19236.1 Do family serine endopeptidase [Ancylomarina euxinus]
MKKFSLLLLSAIMGGVVTLGGFKLLYEKDKSIKIEHITQTPVHGTSYTVNKNGELTPLQFTDVSKKVMDAVVHIKSTQLRGPQESSSSTSPFRDFFNDDFLKEFFGPHSRIQPKKPQGIGPQARVGTGSGVIINPDGYIVTNNHVIEAADDIEISLHDNRVYKAKVIGTDPTTDLALLQIKEKNLTHISFTNSDEIEVGEWVLAVGNPFNLNSTVTAGIVSAKSRNINILQNRSAIESFIQTDAAINPGNSGGALVDLKGGLVGINTAIASPTGAYSGYGFAIPSNIVKKVIDDLLEFGFVQRGYLGILIRNIDGNFAKEKELDVTEGVYVDSLPQNSAAADVGIKKGDVILKVNDTKTKSTAALMEIVARHRPGDQLNIEVNRFGKTKNFTITLRNEKGSTKLNKHEKNQVLSRLGIELELLNTKELDKLNIPAGLRVTQIHSGLIKRQTSMKQGFIITRVDNKTVSNIEDFKKYLEQKEDGIMLSGIYENYPGSYYYAFGLD